MFDPEVTRLGDQLADEIVANDSKTHRLEEETMNNRRKDFDEYGINPMPPGPGLASPVPESARDAAARQYVPPEQYFPAEKRLRAAPVTAQSRPTPSEVDDLWVGLCEDGDILGDGKAYLSKDPAESEVAVLVDSHDTYVRVLKLLVADGALRPADLIRAVQLARMLS